MKKNFTSKNKTLLAGTIAFSVVALLCSYHLSERNHRSSKVKRVEETLLERRLKSPTKRFEIYKNLTQREEGENYPAGHKFIELEKALNQQAITGARSTPRTMIERGPSNVPGRARGLVVLPQDPTHKTWIVGSSGGGIWKTTDGGNSWVNKSVNFSTLAITTIAFCETEPNILYAGSGEYIASSFTAVNGDGIFKSIDAGETWQHLESTANNELWQSVTRLIVDPYDSDIIIATTAPNFWGDYVSNIFKSIDGGDSWYSVYEATFGAVEQIVADPEDFNIQYATSNGYGVLRSTDAGETWNLRSTGLVPEGRVEIAISPVNTDRIYASAVGNLDSSQEADIYYTDDAGASWVLVLDDANTVDVLGGQGWYDNTVLADPYDLDDFYIGGLGIYKYSLNTAGGITTTDPAFLRSDPGGTEVFMARTNFSASLDNGTIEQGSAPIEDFVSVEIRFGPGIKQLAHRFLVPEGRGAGVADSEYSYEDYVEVPFQVWDVSSEPERQLMVSFRDQQRNGTFDLIASNTEGEAEDTNNSHSREYLYINSRSYSSSPSNDISVDGGHVNNDLYFLWPVLADGATWNPSSLPESVFSIEWGSVVAGKIDVVSIADPYNRVDGKNSNVHPDHHNLVAVVHNEPNKTWQIVNVNDGAAYSSNISDDPGITASSWTFAGSQMNTTQFYGADKAPGIDRYVGGAQDNGSWVSREDEVASAASEWVSAWGGDGFDAVWNPDDAREIIVTSQNLGIAKSSDGGETFSGSTFGINDSAPPFIGQFANHPSRGDVVFTVGADGVYTSRNFGSSWSLSTLSDNPQWRGTSLISIEISDATPTIMWSGAVIGSTGSLFRSLDGGQTFSDVPDNGLNTGFISGIGSHPTDHKTVYVLFAYANSPKVIRSTDLGETWEDISGYSDGSESTGFPDVAVYDIQVLPDESNTIWVGSEIGIIESTDDGSTWHLIESTMPRVAVWDLKLKDDQIVIATHGRGVWSYTLSEQPLIVKHPVIRNLQQKEASEFSSTLSFDLQTVSAFDSVEIYLDNQLEDIVRNVEPGLVNFQYTREEEKRYELYVVGYYLGNPFLTSPSFVNLIFQSSALNVPNTSTAEIYPNPASTHFTVKGLEDLNNLSMLDVRGALMEIKQSKDGTFNIDHLKPGIYIVEISDSKNKVIARSRISVLSN
ncbi:MAG: T9SS type A sorting domain-containing protein [Bacteroidota bacterium]